MYISTHICGVFYILSIRIKLENAWKTDINAELISENLFKYIFNDYWFRDDVVRLEYDFTSVSACHENRKN